jgi:radical SAM superfamily enzyme with C-terminal helix-hairpin-helix motif
MGRPAAKQKQADLDPKWRYLILDGYIDEPASLGVPPYISPQVRALAGGLRSGGADPEDIGYITVDQWRELRGRGENLRELRKLESAIIVTGCVVPGKYLGGNPISRREILEASKELSGSTVVLGGPAADTSLPLVRCTGDLGVLGEGLSSSGNIVNMDRTKEEWNEHLINGAFLVWKHPDHPSPLIAEIETSRGCPRFVSGGCSFCIEPKKGPVQFREPENIIKEVRALSDHGLENIRIGGQSDLLTYMSTEVGKSDIPTPDPGIIGEMMIGVKSELHKGKGVKRAESHGRRIGIETGIIHTDNANAAVIHQHPEASGEALKRIVENTTPGNVLALGLESSDPEVRKVNNLNSGPEEIMAAVKMMNEVGAQRGENGMPHLLPGINFLGGLPGQRPESFDHDIKLLDSILKEDLLVRRINIRGALFPDEKGKLGSPFLKGKVHKAFIGFKEKVRREMDPVMLRNMIGDGTVLRGIHIEASSGHVSFGRQIGSYPILVGIEHKVNMNSFIDVVVTEFSSRSITGFETPFHINKMSFRDLQALPGIGKKRAASLFNKMPLKEDIIQDHFHDHPWVIRHIELS